MGYKYVTRKNVLFVEVDRELGGSIYSTIVLAEKVRKLGYSPYMIIPKDCDWEKLLIGKEIPYIKVKAWPWVKRIEDPLNVLKYIKTFIKGMVNLKAELTIRKYILSNEIGIVHIATLNYGVGDLATRWCGKKLVWHMRECLEEGAGIEFIFPDFSKKRINKADKIIAVSQAVYEKYNKFFISEKIKKIWNGIDEKNFYFRKKILVGNEIKIGIIGRVTREKGHEDIIKAFGLLKRDDIFLEIIGDGDEKYINHLKKICIKEGIDKKTQFRGRLDNIPEVLKGVDIVCVCSWYESFGRITVEAMLSGCLVIGANTAGTLEIINNEVTGFLYQQSDYVDLYNKIVYAVSNIEQSRKIALQGQKYALNNFTAERNAELVIEVYEEIYSNLENDDRKKL